MTTKQCMARLQKEYKAILKEPVPGITTHPAPNNMLDWHYVLEGAPATEYEGGVYHGVISFPQQYPFKPPSIKMVTPNGRFAVNTKLCLSMTDFHPESWNPMWSVATILTGLQSFMSDTAHTTGAISSSAEEKKRLAGESLAFNVRNPTFRKLFPEFLARHEERQKAAAAAAKEAETASAAAPEATASGQQQQQQQGAAAPAQQQRGQGRQQQGQQQGQQQPRQPLPQQGRQWGNLGVVTAAGAAAVAAAVAALSLADGDK